MFLAAIANGTSVLVPGIQSFGNDPITGVLVVYAVVVMALLLCSRRTHFAAINRIVEVWST